MERDRYLTEAMGEIWHRCDDMDFWCDMCGEDVPISEDYSTWQGFGKLLPFAEEKIGIGKVFIMMHDSLPFDDGFCDRFASQVFDILTSKA